jgi:delta-aminolevulinic acid dehydratase/porphobilinogen synthase
VSHPKLLKPDTYLTTMNPPERSILQGGYAHPLSRKWQAKRSLEKNMFMYPIFITDDPTASVDIPTLPGQRRWGVDRLEEFLTPLVNKGLTSVILFGVPTKAEKVDAHYSTDLLVVLTADLAIS